MEAAVGMETTLFGGPPEIGNMLKLANGQIGFMTIFAHPLFANVADIIPAMGFAADEILTNKGVWFTRAEQEKKKKALQVKASGFLNSGAVSPRTQSPVRRKDNQLQSSPLRSRKDKPESDLKVEIAGSTRAMNMNHEPMKNESPGSSLAQVSAILTPDVGTPSRKSSDGNKTPRQSSLSHATAMLSYEDHRQENKREDSSRRRSSQVVQDENEGPEESTFRSITDGQTPCGESELQDSRRDASVSMRAGSAHMPVDTGNGITTIDSAKEQPPKAENVESDLSKFTFATSDETEPVRTFDPKKDYYPEHPEERASAPMTNLEHAQQKDKMLEESRNTTSAQSDTNTMGTSLRGGGNDDALTPSHSTTATSCTSGVSEQISPTPKGNHPDLTRVSSAPIGVGLKQSYSLNSDQSTSREGSKNDVRTMIFANGETQEDRSRARKASTKTVGRRSSRMKLKNLAFWKKRDKGIEGSAEV